MSEKKILVIGAHSADFVWRAAGTIATVTAGGGSASVVALSYGERGELGELWKQPDQTVENVKRIRHEEAKTAAEAVGADFRCLDLGDYPLNATEAGIEQLVNIFQDFQPGIVITHSPVDPFNPDHPVASQLVQKARLPIDRCGRCQRVPEDHAARALFLRTAPARTVRLQAQCIR